MSFSETLSLVRQLPKANPYFAWLSRTLTDGAKPLSWGVLLWRALLDAALGAHLAMTYAKAGLSLPAFITDPVLTRANLFWLRGDPPDRALATALAEMLITLITLITLIAANAESARAPFHCPIRYPIQDLTTALSRPLGA